jgi:hypothetical protein
VLVLLTNSHQFRLPYWLLAAVQQEQHKEKQPAQMTDPASSGEPASYQPKGVPAIGRKHKSDCHCVWHPAETLVAVRTAKEVSSFEGEKFTIMTISAQETKNASLDHQIVKMQTTDSLTAGCSLCIRSISQTFPSSAITVSDSTQKPTLFLSH